MTPTGNTSADTPSRENVDRWERARRIFRRDTAKWSFRLVYFTVLLMLAVGLTSDVGASRVETIGPVIATMLVAPVSIILGYLGFSAWESKLQPKGSTPSGYNY